MRIAIANGGICFSRGGAERSAIRLAHAMRERGHGVHLLTTVMDKSPVYPLDPCLPVHFFPLDVHRGKMESVARGGDLLREYKIDIMVALESDWKHALWQHCAADANVPFVCSERITPFLIEHKTWSARTRRDFLHLCAGIHELLPCYLRYIPEDLRDRAFVIPNAAPDDTPAVCPQQYGGAPVILFLGRFAKQKRPWLLLQAFAQLAQEFPDWTLRFAGWGAEAENMEALRHELGLDDRVEIRWANANVGEEYSNANIYCLPTQYEGFPNSVLEAMAYALPVVGIADSAAMMAIVKPGVTGMIAAKATPEALAATLRPLMASEKPRLRIGRAGYKDCRQNYDPQKIFGEWEKQLCRIVENYRQ